MLSQSVLRWWLTVSVFLILILGACAAPLQIDHEPHEAAADDRMTSLEEDIDFEDTPLVIDSEANIDKIVDAALSAMASEDWATPAPSDDYSPGEAVLIDLIRSGVYESAFRFDENSDELLPGYVAIDMETFDPVQRPYFDLNMDPQLEQYGLTNDSVADYFNYTYALQARAAGCKPQLDFVSDPDGKIRVEFEDDYSTLRWASVPVARGDILGNPDEFRSYLTDLLKDQIPVGETVSPFEVGNTVLQATCDEYGACVDPDTDPKPKCPRS